MTFWVHSFRARRERDYAVLHKDERNIAKAVLAGWVFVPRPSVLIGHLLWDTYDKHGHHHGFNATRELAASYALSEMERPNRCRHGYRLFQCPVCAGVKA